MTDWKELFDKAKSNTERKNIIRKVVSEMFLNALIDEFNKENEKTVPNSSKH